MEEGRVRVGEFFSGIGAMHFALKQAMPTAQVTHAFDINQVANTTYAHNHHLQPNTFLVEHKPTNFFARLNLDCWLLSPPCQPFTRGGNQRDHQDERSIGLLHLIKVLEELDRVPRFVFLENVLNFEVSECHRLLLLALKKRGFYVEEYLISPLDIGVPNDRLRYYLVAVLDPKDTLQSNGQIITSLYQVNPDRPAVSIKPIQEYLVNDVIQPVKAKYLTDYKNYKHDVCHPQDLRSTTFTKAYGSDYIIGTGSFLQTCNLDIRDYPKDDPNVLSTLGLRFFSPREVANLHCFPKSFEFASNTSLIQQYRLLGNSMNVAVVAALFKRMFVDLGGLQA